MSKTLSVSILERLRREAALLGRSEQRLATLDRLVEACDAIHSGSARAVIRKGNPPAEVYFRAQCTSIIPPRIEDYVLARRELDRREGVPSMWTGPVASSLRKEGQGMLAYVRARDMERANANGALSKPKPSGEWWQLIDGISDEAAKLRLMRELSEGSEAKRTVAALRAAVRLCSATFDIDGYLRGDFPHAHADDRLLPANTASVPHDVRTVLGTLVRRLVDKDQLALFDLEYDGRRVRQKASKDTLIDSKELAALLGIAGAVS